MNQNTAKTTDPIWDSRNSEEPLIEPSKPRDFAYLQATQLSKARAKHGDMKCQHEAYAVILEELDEFWQEVKAQKFDKENALKELTQVAAMCQRAAEDLKLL